MIFLYNILFVIGFLLFLPDLIWKYLFRGGRKKDYLERFGIFSKEKKQILKQFSGDVWIHSVSVGETQIALSLINTWLTKNPERKFILSTTTTTAQELAFNKLPKNTALVFCPLDFIFIVQRALKLFRPRLLVILETEIWPNLICETRKSGACIALVNARISDKSAGRYQKFRFFFQKVLSQVHAICVQTELDAERFLRISQNLPIHICGNMKFDQNLKELSVTDINLENYFGKNPANVIILAASTHPGEEIFITKAYLKIKEVYPDLKLIIVPRHAERGASIAGELKKFPISFTRRSKESKVEKPVDCLLADTTGELIKFIALCDIVIMGKAFAGHTEGHNLIEPALLGKPIITGKTLSNFRYILQVLQENDGVITVSNFEELCEELKKLVMRPELRTKVGENAKSAIKKHRGAVEKTINLLEQLLAE